MHRILVVGALVVAITACSGGSLTAAEYAASAEELVAAMEADFASLDSEWEAQRPTLDGARDYWQRRMTIRHEFLEGIRALDPPAEVAEMHETALDLFGRITAADEAIAARVETFTSITDHHQWDDTPEGRTSLAVLEDVFEFCRASQAEFDATQDREAFEGVTWLPPEMKEAIRVAFGCPPAGSGS